MHTISSMENEPKYTSSCHMDDQSTKQFTTVGSCHPQPPATSDDVENNSMTVIKSEDGSSDITHSYVLPPFLH